MHSRVPRQIVFGRPTLVYLPPVCGGASLYFVQTLTVVLWVQAKGDKIVESTRPLEIHITTDDKTKTITFQDSGVGMSKDELIANIGTIARSGSKAFVQKMKGEVGFAVHRCAPRDAACQSCVCVSLLEQQLYHCLGGGFWGWRCCEMQFVWLCASLLRCCVHRSCLFPV